MKTTILKQHKYKTGSVKSLLEHRTEEGKEILDYSVRFVDNFGVTLSSITVNNLQRAIIKYRNFQINQSNEKFMTKRGELTRYALSCGYIEQHIFADGSYKKLWQDSAALHVRYINLQQHEESFWEIFGLCELTAARKLYRSIKNKA